MLTTSYDFATPPPPPPTHTHTHTQLERCSVRELSSAPAIDSEIAVNLPKLYRANRRGYRR